jgi:hypothetical protein
MFEQISFYISGNRIEVTNQSFWLGELTTDILDIRPDEFSVMYTLTKNMRRILNHVETRCDRDEMRSLTVWARELHSMLMKRKLFQLISQPMPFDEMDKLYEFECEEKIQQSKLQAWQEFFPPVEKLCDIVDDIYSFNETMFWFIDNFLMKLKKLDSENYAAALYDFYTQPGLDKMMVNFIRNKNQTYTWFDTVAVQYVPREIPGNPAHYAIYECYAVTYLQAFLKMDFMKAIINGHIIRRCKNCHHLFMLTKGYHTDYCDRPLPSNPKRNCRNQGAKNIAKEKAANNPMIRSYNRAYQRVTADKQRGRISMEDWKKAKRKILDLRDEAISGKHSDRELDAMLQQEPLYASLSIIRKGGR